MNFKGKIKIFSIVLIKECKVERKMNFGQILVISEVWGIGISDGVSLEVAEVGKNDRKKSQSLWRRHGWL